jgi:hypothetical protein
MSKHGFVYVLKNKSMPGLLKIGYTTKMPSERAMELYGCGVPTPFEIVFAVWSEIPAELEALIHKRLAFARVSTNRECFDISEANAIHVVLEKITLPIKGVHVVRQWSFIDPDVMEQYADCVDVCPSEIGNYVENKLAEAVALCNSMREKRDEERRIEENGVDE